MDYQTYQPHESLASVIQCYWTLQVPAEAEKSRQRIVPDGCIEMAFILGDDIKRYVAEHEYIIQPRAMILGQTLKPFYIEPTGFVDTFAVRFYPYGFSNFVNLPMGDLVEKETPIHSVFGEEIARSLEQDIIQASCTEERIEVIQAFLLHKFNDEHIIQGIVQSTVDAILLSGGGKSISNILENSASRPRRRQLERDFIRQIGVSPKQLGRVIRLQAALKMMVDSDTKSLTEVAYEKGYYDQAHFIKDFQQFTGVSPKEFLDSDKLKLSALFYDQ